MLSSVTEGWRSHEYTYPFSIDPHRLQSVRQFFTSVLNKQQLSMKKNFLLIAGNYFPEPTGIGKYNGEMMKWLAEQGHSCTVITTFPYYPQWKIQEKYSKRCFWFKTERIDFDYSSIIKVIRCPHYIPKNPSGVYRLISEFSFFFSAYLVVLFLLFKEQFDYIITVAPPFEIGLLGVLYKKIRGGKFICHIQDLQIDAARDLGMIKSRRIINFFLIIERYILKQSDYVSTISLGMIEKVKKKCGKEVLYFPNWVDIDLFYPLENKEEIKREYGFKSTQKIILYSGAIGHKQGLEAILQAAKRLEYLVDIKFAICGSGPYKEILVNMAAQMNLKNLIFLPLQKPSKLNCFLNMADLHLVLQKTDGADLFLPSKLSTILSVGGVAIVTASNGSSLYNIMNSTNMGILIEPENQDELVAAIINNIHSDQIAIKGRNARIYAEHFLSNTKILVEHFSTVLSG